MPKAYMTRQEKLNRDLSAWLIGTMRVRGLRQTDAAEALGISQQAFSLKLKRATFRFDDLVCLFGLLETDAKTVANLMGVGE